MAHNRTLNGRRDEKRQAATSPWGRRLRLLGVAGIGAGLIAGGLGVYVTYFGVIPDSVAILFPQVVAPSAEDRVLVFSPHPDDETLGAAGYMARAIRNGGEAAVVVATDGNRRGLKEKRRGETLRAMEALGVPEEAVEFWDYPDGRLSEHADQLPARIREAVLAFDPTIVVFPNPADGHRDHSALGATVAAYLDGAAYGGIRLQYLVHFPNFPRPEGLSASRHLLPPARLITRDRAWLVFPLDSELQDAKHEAILQYKSQLKIPTLRLLLLSFVRQNELFSN
ncbi:MAG: PIG-L family deacetylase [Candidatus Colwellbacteria bacterium]|nr:PIG-L family deacetylase [Candidatus Colwellbacteria bacterium]